MWTENYGDSTADVSATFTNAIDAMKSDLRIPLLGCITSLFEASMYTFVFMWTPALQGGAEETDGVLPFGLIFACFMVAVMLGSTIFGAAVSGNAAFARMTGISRPVNAREVGLVLLLASSLAMAVPALTSNQQLNFLAFLVFEICCGLYFPCFGTLRGIHVPEATRAAISNFFRVPLNFLVVVVLVKVGDFETQTVFQVCALWLAVATGLMKVFNGMAEAEEGTQSKDLEDENRFVEVADDKGT
jgi:MFS transporter, MFS domain-containing protein family, molybdate-anion transporter